MECQRIKNVVENAFRKKWGTNKESYILLLNGFGTPLEAITAMQKDNKDFSNILLN